VAFDLIKSGTKTFFIRPFLGAYQRFKSRQKGEKCVSIDRFRLVFRDAAITIENLAHTDLLAELENIFQAVAENLELMTQGTKGQLFEIFIPVLEDTSEEPACKFRTLLSTDETLDVSRISRADYLKFLGALNALGEFGERVQAGRREERFYGTADLPNFYRKPFGPGWALVGDAGYRKDPYMTLGVADAFRDAGLLARAIDNGLSGRAPLDESLAEYETLHNEQAAEEYQENLKLARLAGPCLEALQLRAALKGNQEQINLFAMVRGGMIPRDRFFNPENLLRLGMGLKRPGGTLVCDRRLF